MIYVLRNYSQLDKIVDITASSLLFFSFDENRIVFKEWTEDFILIDLKRKKALRSNNKIRKLDESLAYPIRTIIVSCFNDSMFLNYV